MTIVDKTESFDIRLLDEQDEWILIEIWQVICIWGKVNAFRLYPQQLDEVVWSCDEEVVVLKWKKVSEVIKVISNLVVEDIIETRLLFLKYI